MQFTVVYTKVSDPSFEGYYYAHVPSLGLTTHGIGIEGAKEAVQDLIRLWIKEKGEHGEQIKEEAETFYSQIEI